MTLARSRCKDCDGSILWSVLADGAKRPLDANPTAKAEGMYYLSDLHDGGLPFACYVRLDDRQKHAALYAAHACPDAPRQTTFGLEEEATTMK